MIYIYKPKAIRANQLFLKHDFSAASIVGALVVAGSRESPGTGLV